MVARSPAHISFEGVFNENVSISTHPPTRPPARPVPSSHASGLGSEADIAEYLEAAGLSPGGSLGPVIEQARRLLRLQAFYTVGPKEARAWAVEAGAAVWRSCAVMHLCGAELLRRTVV